MENISQHWIVIDQNNKVYECSDFREALEHPKRSGSIMTKEYYTTIYTRLLKTL